MSELLKWDWTNESKYRKWAEELRADPAAIFHEMPMFAGEPMAQILFSPRLKKTAGHWKTITLDQHNNAYIEWLRSMRTALRRVLVNHSEVDSATGLVCDLIEVYAHDGCLRVMTPVVAVVTGGIIYVGMAGELVDEDFLADKILLRTELEYNENPE